MKLNEIVVNVRGQYKPGRETLTMTDFKIPLARIPINITGTLLVIHPAGDGEQQQPKWI